MGQQSAHLYISHTLCIHLAGFSSGHQTVILITLSDYVICFESVMFDPNAVIHASVVEIRMKFKIFKLNSASNNFKS